jgi:hypothetical protein
MTINLLKLFLFACQEVKKKFVEKSREGMGVFCSAAKEFRLVLFLAEQITNLC